MEGFLEILRDLGFFGIAVFALKKIFEKWINKDIEKYKHELKQEQIRSSKLYDKRREVIDELYELLEDFNQKMHSLTSPIEWAGELSKEEKFKLASEAGEKFSKFYLKKEMYFNEKLNELLRKINDLFKKAWVDSTMFFEKNLKNAEKWKYLIDGWKKITEEIPPVKKEIQKEFRNILGTE